MCRKWWHLCHPGPWMTVWRRFSPLTYYLFSCSVILWIWNRCVWAVIYLGIYFFVPYILCKQLVPLFWISTAVIHWPQFSKPHLPDWYYVMCPLAPRNHLHLEKLMSASLGLVLLGWSRVQGHIPVRAIYQHYITFRSLELKWKIPSWLFGQNAESLAGGSWL